ncbi:MAG: VWA domain-containing protein [Bryobacteraceae bacterium]
MVKRVGICVFAFSLCGLAQQPAPPPSSSEPIDAGAAAPIRVTIEEVIVPVTITDPKGRFVSNLERKDFEVIDSGRTQTIRYFSRERSQPVVVGFLLDLSNSSRPQWKNFQNAARELVLTLMPGKDQFAGYVIGYSNQAELMVNTTTDPEPLVNKIDNLRPGGGAALYDAIYMACTNRALVKGEPIEPRRVIVVIGDGNDNASSKTLNEVLEVAQKNLVTIYGISTQAYGMKAEGNDNLLKLAEETGGRVEYPLENVYKDVQGFASTPSDEGNFSFKVGTGGYAAALSSSVFRSIANVAGEVTTQYILRYIPDVPENANSFREINVKVSLPDVTVRARKGYYPSGE